MHTNTISSTTTSPQTTRLIYLFENGLEYAYSCARTLVPFSTVMAYAYDRNNGVPYYDGCYFCVFARAACERKSSELVHDRNRCPVLEAAQAKAAAEFALQDDEGGLEYLTYCATTGVPFDRAEFDRRAPHQFFFDGEEVHAECAYWCYRMMFLRRVAACEETMHDHSSYEEETRKRPRPPGPDAMEPPRKKRRLIDMNLLPVARELLF
jgi:hypothetical protein